MRAIKWLFLILVLSMSNHTFTGKKSTMDYSCSGVPPEYVYAEAGEKVDIYLPDCFFFTALGTGIGGLPPVDITFDEEMVQEITLEPDKTTPLQQISFYPKRDDFYVFRYIPIEGSLRGRLIELIIRSEPISPVFKNILQTQLKEAQKKNDTEKAEEINEILADIDNKSLAHFYRRVRPDKQFSSLYTKIFAESPEQVKVDIGIRPNGNLQVTEEDKLTEIKFGSYK